MRASRIGDVPLIASSQPRRSDSKANNGKATLEKSALVALVRTLSKVLISNPSEAAYTMDEESPALHGTLQRRGEAQAGVSWQG